MPDVLESALLVYGRWKPTCVEACKATPRPRLGRGEATGYMASRDMEQVGKEYSRTRDGKSAIFLPDEGYE